MSQFFPLSLPLAEATGYTQAPVSKFTRSTMASGRLVQRRTSPRAPTSQKLVWLMTGAEKLAFRAWYEKALRGGAEPFWIDLWLDQELRKVEVLFSSPPTEEMNEASQTEWKITATIDILSELSDVTEEPTVVYAVSGKITHRHTDTVSSKIRLGVFDFDHTVVAVSVIALIPTNGVGVSNLWLGHSGVSPSTGSIISSFNVGVGNITTKYFEEVINSSHPDAGLQLGVPALGADNRNYYMWWTEPATKATLAEYLVVMRYTKP